MNEANKPTILIYEELKKNIADLINNSGLPPFIIEPILKDFLNEAHIATQRQYEIEKNQYEKSISSTTETDVDNN